MIDKILHCAKEQFPQIEGKRLYDKACVAADFFFACDERKQESYRNGSVQRLFQDAGLVQNFLK